jgi:hypothetical protein
MCEADKQHRLYVGCHSNELNRDDRKWNDPYGFIDAGKFKHGCRVSAMSYFAEHTIVRALMTLWPLFSILLNW